MTSATDTKADFLINPARFPWLAQVASGYDTYLFRALRVRWVPKCPTTYPGRIVMFVDYDPTDDNAGLSPSAASQNAGAVTASVWTAATCPFNPSLTVLPQHRYFVSDSVTPDRLNDCGRIWLYLDSTSPVTAGSPLGSLWVDYTVYMSNPEHKNISGRAVSFRPSTAAPTVDNDHPTGTAQQVITVAKEMGQAMNQVRNLAPEITTCAGAVNSRATIQALVGQEGEITNIYDFESHIPDRETNTAPDAQSTITARTTAAPTAVWYYFDPDRESTWVIFQLAGTWTPTVADTPHLKMEFADGWDVQENWLVQDGATTPPRYWFVGVVHLRRKANMSPRVLAFTAYFTGVGTWSNAGYDFKLMETPQPWMENWVPRY